MRVRRRDFPFLKEKGKKKKDKEIKRLEIERLETKRLETKRQRGKKTKRLERFLAMGGCFVFRINI
jgi:hypothetical protein